MTLVVYQNFNAFKRSLLDKKLVFDEKALAYTMEAKIGHMCMLKGVTLEPAFGDDLYLFFKHTNWSRVIDLDEIYASFVAIVEPIVSEDDDTMFIQLICAETGNGKNVMRMIEEKTPSFLNDYQYSEITLNSLPQALLFYIELGFDFHPSFRGYDEFDAENMRLVRSEINKLTGSQKRKIGKALEFYFDEDEHKWPSLEEFSDASFDGLGKNVTFNKYIFKMFQDGENGHPTMTKPLKLQK